MNKISCKNDKDNYNISDEKQIKSKDVFDKLRSNFILKRIFKHMKRNKILEIIKYNITSPFTI